MVVSKSNIIQSINPNSREILGEVPLMLGADVTASVEVAWN
jgi:hypothetical protein